MSDVEEEIHSHGPDETELECDLSNNTKDEDSESLTRVALKRQDFLGKKSFVYNEKVELTVTKCRFRRPVEFIFYDDATIIFEGNSFFASAYFESYGKAEIKFKGCNFNASKEVFFHQNSTLSCEENICLGSALYKGYANLQTKFQRCSFYERRRCSAERLVADPDGEFEYCEQHASSKCKSKHLNYVREENGVIRFEDEAEKHEKDIALIEKAIFRFILWLLTLFILIRTADFVLHSYPEEWMPHSIRNSAHANLNTNEKQYYYQENGQIEEITKMSIAGETIFSQKNYNFDEKVDVMVHGSTFMGNTKFQFNRDANLTVMGCTCMGSTTFEGHGKLNITLIGSTFMGEFTAIFHGDGVLNCQRATFMGSAKYDHEGEIQKYVTNCVFMASDKY